nr:hypothetical protein [Tanacetum cinerariifolium]
HAQRPVLRPLALGRHTDLDRRRKFPPQRLRPRQSAAVDQPRSAAAPSTGRDGGGEPVLGQQPRAVPAARTRHRPCPRRRGHDRLRHERRATAAPQRLSLPADRAGLVLDLLGQDAERDRGTARP